MSEDCADKETQQPSTSADAHTSSGFPARPISRRGFVGGSFAALAAMAATRESSLLFAGEDKEPQNLYWGDIHNHNECGLAKGTLERAIDLARGHLDFWAATGHAWWHDMPELPGTGRKMFFDGFERHRKFWAENSAAGRRVDRRRLRRHPRLRMAFEPVWRLLYAVSRRQSGIVFARSCHQAA